MARWLHDLPLPAIRCSSSKPVTTKDPLFAGVTLPPSTGGRGQPQVMNTKSLVIYGTGRSAGPPELFAVDKRTGEQIRDVKVQAKPKPRRLPGPSGEFTEGTVYRARVGSWKRPLVATALVFGRNNFSPRYTNAKTYQWVESLSSVHGRHSFKAGADMIWQRIDNFFPGQLKLLP